MPDLTKYKVTVGTAVTYHFSFEEPFGWAIFTVNDATGEFQIQSDWGEWQFRWNIDSLGGSAKRSSKPLTHFLAVRPNPSYVVMKFGYNKPDSFEREFDLDETIKWMGERIIEARKEARGRSDDFINSRKYTLSAKQARACFNQLKEWKEEHHGDSEAALVMSIESMRACQSDLYDFLTGRDGHCIDQDVYEDFQYKPSWGYTFLLKRLLPFFFEYLRREVLHVDGEGKAA